MCGQLYPVYINIEFLFNCGKQNELYYYNLVKIFSASVIQSTEFLFIFYQRTIRYFDDDADRFTEKFFKLHIGLF